MKKSLAFVVLLVTSLFIMACNKANAQAGSNSENTPPEATYQATANLRLRETPSTSANVVTTVTQNSEVALLEKGESVTIEGRSAPWFKVKTSDGAIGWCFSAYLVETTVPIASAASGGTDPVAGTHWEGTASDAPSSIDFGNGTAKWTYEVFGGYETVESTYKVQTAVIFTVEDGPATLIMEGDSLILFDPDSRDYKFIRKSGKALKGSKWEGDFDGEMYTLEFTGNKVKMAGDGKKYESTYITCSVIGFDNFAGSDEAFYLKLKGDKLSDTFSEDGEYITLTKSKAKAASDAGSGGGTTAKSSGKASPITDFEYEIDSDEDLGGTVAIIEDYIGHGGAVVIPAEIQGWPVAGIASDAFMGRWRGQNFPASEITSIVIPASVKVIGADAFAFNDKLTSVTFLGTVGLHPGAFKGCKNLSELKFPAGDNILRPRASLSEMYVLGGHDDPFKDCPKLPPATIAKLKEWGFKE